jgi:hypothetical protein
MFLNDWMILMKSKIIIGFLVAVGLTFAFSSYQFKAVPDDGALATSEKTVLTNTETTAETEAAEKGEELLSHGNESNKFEGYLKCCDAE